MGKYQKCIQYPTQSTIKQGVILYEIGLCSQGQSPPCFLLVAVTSEHSSTGILDRS